MQALIQKHCSVSECLKPHSAKGFCQKHYDHAQYVKNREKRAIKNRKRYVENRDKLGNLYQHVRAEAKKRNIRFALALADLEEARKWPCFYCEGPLPLTGAGLDRISNDKAIGYCPSNVLPCCTVCNRMRGNWLTVRETRIAAQAIKAHRHGEAA